jgi:hypothetical protein
MCSPARAVECKLKKCIKNGKIRKGFYRGKKSLKCCKKGAKWSAKKKACVPKKCKKNGKVQKGFYRGNMSLKCCKKGKTWSKTKKSCIPRKCQVKHEKWNEKKKQCMCKKGTARHKPTGAYGCFLLFERSCVTQRLLRMQDGGGGGVI